MPSLELVVVMFALEISDGPCSSIPFLDKICLLLTSLFSLEIDDIISVCISELEVHSAYLVVG